MAETEKFKLPLLDPAQAQKHVTVNEALVKADANLQLTLASQSSLAPPGSPVDGVCYAVPAGATGDWAGQDGMVAHFANGGWSFLAPQPGWRAWVEDEGAVALCFGSAWVPGAVAISPSGAALCHLVVEIDHVVGAGPTSDTTTLIPANAMVYGVTGRVLSVLTGSLTSWRIGVAGADDRYGSGLGLVAGSYAHGVTSAPQAYYAATALRLTGEGGDFTAGTVRLAVHLAEITVPGV